MPPIPPRDRRSQPISDSPPIVPSSVATTARNIKLRAYYDLLPDIPIEPFFNHHKSMKSESTDTLCTLASDTSSDGLKDTRSNAGNQLDISGAEPSEISSTISKQPVARVLDGTMQLECKSISMNDLKSVAAPPKPPRRSATRIRSLPRSSDVMLPVAGEESNLNTVTEPNPSGSAKDIPALSIVRGSPSPQGMNSSGRVEYPATRSGDCDEEKRKPFRPPGGVRVIF